MARHVRIRVGGGGGRFGGMTLKELGEKTGGMDYAAVAVSVIRLVEKSKDDRALRKWMKYVAEKCQM